MPMKRKELSKHAKIDIPRQVIRRNTGNAPPNVCVKANNGSQMEDTMQELHPIQRKTPQQAAGNKLAIPQFNTMIGRKHEIISMPQMTIQVNPNLTPRTMASIAPKITQKMNFPPNKTVFKDLASLNVNDTLRELARPKAVRKKTTKEATKPNIMEPQLSDYLEEVHQLFLVLPEPSLVMSFPMEDFDFLGAIKRHDML
ncbi:GH10378 [Drosophila grimshawi]|uniref:GH10378 n=1 Tax=Drosophila grimshawi TaxID=7222 RepID=B4JEE3_DROGR|nr:GH10378 [Drosophila grimshawi]